MKKKKIFLSCVAVAITTFVGNIVWESHVNVSNNLLMQNVEALSQGDNYALIGYAPVRGKDVCTLYVNGVITRGRLSVCEPASPSETCVSGVCMVP